MFQTETLRDNHMTTKTPHSKQYEIWVGGFYRVEHQPFPTRKQANDWIKTNIDNHNQHKYSVREML